MKRVPIAVLLVLAVITIAYATYLPYAEDMRWKYVISGYESYWDREYKEDSYEDSLSGTMLIEVLDEFEFAGKTLYEVANIYTLHYHNEAEPFENWDVMVTYVEVADDYVYVYEWLEDVAADYPVSEIPVNPEIGDTWEAFESFWIYDYVQCEVVDDDVDIAGYTGCLELDLTYPGFEEEGDFTYFWYLAPDAGLVYMSIEDHYKDRDVKYDDSFSVQLVEFSGD